MSRENFGIFFNRAFLLLNVAVFVQQLIVASSTYFIARLGESVANHQTILPWLVLFIASLFIVYGPSSLALCLAERMKFDSLRAYIEKFSATFYGRTGWRTNHRLKKDLAPYVSSEAFSVITQFVEFYSYWMGFLLNVVLNVVFFGALLDLKVFAAYALSIGLSFWSAGAFSKAISEKTARSQERKVNLTHALLATWDNVFIGNLLNHRIWKEEFEKTWDASRGSQVGLVYKIELLSSLTTAFTLLPIVSILIYLCNREAHNWGFLAILIATLPRHVQTIQNISTLVQMSFQWASVRSKVETLYSTTTLPEETSLAGKVTWDLLRISKDGVSTPASSIRDIAKHFGTSGRITIRGQNGSGKSSLAALIKESSPGSVFYLPAHSDLMFRGMKGENYSTGEKIIASVQEIMREATFSTLVMDEWDANLDQEHVRLISDRLDVLSETVLVIEIRHRGEAYA